MSRAGDVVYGGFKAVFSVNEEGKINFLRFAKKDFPESVKKESVQKRIFQNPCAHIFMQI